jgi:hypothetical protein
MIVSENGHRASAPPTVVALGLLLLVVLVGEAVVASVGEVMVPAIVVGEEDAVG